MNETNANLRAPETPKNKSEVKELIRFALIALLVVLPIRLFIAQPFIVEGASMDPTFSTGQYLIVDELSYHVREPVRGEVVIFKYPKDPSRYYIKRIIGLPGETVIGNKDTVKVINESNPLGFFIDESYVENHSTYNFKFELKEGEFFVMGDNRPASSDSRVWGAVPRSNLIGRAYLRLLPPSSMSYLPGAVPENNNQDDNLSK